MKESALSQCVKGISQRIPAISPAHSQRRVSGGGNGTFRNMGVLCREILPPLLNYDPASGFEAGFRPRTQETFARLELSDRCLALLTDRPREKKTGKISKPL